MDKKIAIGAIAASFVLGAVIGGEYVKKVIIEKVKETEAVVANIVSDIIIRQHEENLSAEEVTALVRDGVKFIDIAARE